MIGLLLNLGNHLYRFLCYGNEISVRRIYRFISLREIEYLVLIKRENVILYGDVLRMLKEIRSDDDGKFCLDNIDDLVSMV